MYERRKCAGPQRQDAGFEGLDRSCYFPGWVLCMDVVFVLCVLPVFCVLCSVFSANVLCQCDVVLRWGNCADVLDSEEPDASVGTSYHWEKGWNKRPPPF
jgi:hypothetical protein